MRKPLIEAVSTNQSKNKTYTALMKSYKEAMRQGFFGEAELIVYAYLEDQLKGFIYHSDGLNFRNARTVNENLQEIIGHEQNIDNISKKIKVIKKMFSACGKTKIDSGYVEFLRKIFEASISIPEFKNNLNKISKWCKYRDEVVHSMFHKDLDSLRAGLKDHIEEGYQLGRYVDKQVKSIRRA